MTWWRSRLSLTIREAHRITGAPVSVLNAMLDRGELQGPMAAGKTRLIWPESLEERFGRGPAAAAERLNPVVERKLRQVSGRRA